MDQRVRPARQHGVGIAALDGPEGVPDRLVSGRAGRRRRGDGPTGAGVHGERGRVVVEGFGIKTLHEGDIVHDAREMRQQFGEPDTRFAVLLEFVIRAEDGGILADLGQADVFKNLFGHLLAVALDQFRLVVEQVQMRGTAGLEKINDVFGLGLEMRPKGLGGCRVGCGGGKKIFVQQ